MIQNTPFKNSRSHTTSPLTGRSFHISQLTSQKPWTSPMASDVTSLLPNTSMSTPVLALNLTSNPPRSHAMGYFTFPPDGSMASFSKDSEAEEERRKQQDSEKQQRQEELDQEAAWAARTEQDAELHRQRLVREETEALRGEEEWVRSGGILRDAEGRRDMARTEAVRAELKLRELEQSLIRKWETYEKRWKALLGRTDTVKFEDIPWPVDVDVGLPLQDLTLNGVEDFLLSGLKVRGCTVTKKERIRNSLLRWHPDKMTGIVKRVDNQDMESVKQGINIVMSCLQQLNSKV